MQLVILFISIAFRLHSYIFFLAALHHVRRPMEHAAIALLGPGCAVHVAAALRISFLS